MPSGAADADPGPAALAGFGAPGVSAKQAVQREKMKACNADATSKGLAGDERVKFMSTCLTGRH